MRQLLKKSPDAALAPRPVGAAGGMAWQEGLVLLKKNGADLNAVWRGYRPMHALIQEAPHAHGGKPTPERIKCLQWMIENGADPELEGAWPPSRALLVAIFTGVPDYVAVLRDSDAKVDGFAYAALGDLKKVEKLLKADAGFVHARTAPQGTTALQCCAASRMKVKTLTDTARLLLDHGADPNVLCKGWTHDLDVTYFAANSGQKETFDLLLEKGANPNNALVQAMWQKNPSELGEIALRHGADVNRAGFSTSSCQEDNRPLLNQMIRWGQLQSTFWLLHHGANPNLADGRGWTALHQAASRGNERMLQAVLDAGADPKKKTVDGHTPLDIARLQKVTRAVKQLMKSAT